MIDKLWLDDLREPPDSSWVWVKTADKAIEALSSGVDIASLDHDLGTTRSSKERSGYTVVLWMAENNVWPTEAVVIHSWNSIGSERMAAMVDRYGPYERKCQRIPAIQP